MLEFGKSGSVMRFNPSQIIPYRLKFRTDYISFAPNNDLLFEGLEAYDSLNPGFQQPRMGLLLKGNFKDLLENYVLEAGVRIPVNLGGAEYYVWLDDKKRRIDRRFAVYRRTQTTSFDESGGLPGPPANRRVQIRNTTLLGMYEMSYPLDVFTSFRAAVMLRQDKRDSLSTNISTLESDPRASQRAFLRLSAVYDNTVDVDINLKTGTRAKLYFDVVKRFAFNTRPDWSLKLNEGFMNVVGLDARHYQPVLRHAIFAVRLAAAASFGTEKMLYYLGGVENPLFARDNFNQSIPLPRGGNFAFETQATNLRGFKLNIRNGNSYALLNTELRVPIFKYFSRKPVMGNFWRNFQLAGFLDVGTAWQGKNPYSGDNPLNIVYISNPPTVFLKVNYFRDPLVAGYGLGLRTTLFGMYLRADYAWGVETKVIQKPMLHIAMGTDF
jgi:Omp85 superfamily domain